MINRVIVSGVLANENVEFVHNTQQEYLSYCDAMIITQDYKKDKLKQIKVRFYNSLAREFVAKQEVYKENLCMYFVRWCKVKKNLKKIQKH